MLSEAPAWVPLGLAVAAVLASYLLWIHTYWARRGVPHVRPRFLVGNLWESTIQKRTHGHVLGDIYRQFEKQPFVGVYKTLMKPVLLVKDPELVQEVLVKNFGSFQNNEIVFPPGKDEVFSDNPFMADFERWKDLRTRVSQAFTPARVRLAFDDMAFSGQKLVDLLVATGDKTSLDGEVLVKRYTAHASVRVLFGLESNTLEPGKEPGPFYDMGHKIFNSEDLLSRLRFIAFLSCPSMLKVLGYSFVNQDTLSFFRKLILDSVQYRAKEGITRDDFVQHAAKLVLADGKVDDEALRSSTARAINAFVETFETAATTVISTLVLLAVHPEVQSKVRAELRAAFPAGKLTTYDELLALPYLDSVWKESMRYFPTGDTLRRSCTKPITLQASTGETVSLRPGDAVYVGVHAMHHDPAYYSHPDEFYPEHFSEEESAARPKCAYLPFGDGPRMCPGYRFGTLQVKVALASVLLHLEVLPAPELVLPPQRDPKAAVMGILGGPWLRFRPI